MSKLMKICVAMLAVLALTGATAVAAPSTAKLTASKVKKIANKAIAKAAPTLTVATAANATNATTATKAGDANTVGGKTPAQLKTVIASGPSPADVANIGAGTIVATVDYTLAAPSTVLITGVAELSGDAPNSARCIVVSNDVNASLGYSTSFDDAGTANPQTVTALSSALTLPAGTHTAALECIADSGSISKDDAAVQVVAVPN